MARDKPVTDAEIEGLRDAMRQQRAGIREDLEAAGVDVSTWEDSQVEARADGGDDE